MKLKVHGKINIALNITGVKSGMHLIDTVMASISLFDDLEINVDRNISVTCDLPLSGKNIALTAAEKIYEITGKCLIIDIKKGIPLGGGLGGSSADAAGVLVAANRLLGLDQMCDINALALSLGADVPYMMTGGFCRAMGFGERLTPFEATGGMRLLLAECGSVATGECYRISDTTENKSADIDEVISALKRGELKGSNALTPAARILNPRIAEAEKIFDCCLSGSGGCVFGQYSEKAKAALISAGFAVHEIHIMGKGIS